MEIYFKFKSTKAFESLPLEGPFTTVASFKHQIYQLKYKGKQNAGLCYGNDFDIRLINAQTNQPYAEENALIPSNTRLLIQRIPGGRRNKPIDTSPIIIPGCLKPKSSSSASKSDPVATASTVTSNSCGDSEGEKSETFGFTESYPVELLCPLCERPMKDAAFTSKCCFRSFCDPCIRTHLIRSKFKCVCGAGDMLTDYLIPNVTVRGLIGSVLESGFTIQRLRANVQISTSASKCQGVEEEEEQETKKRKRESCEEVEKRNCVMRTGFYPCNSFGKNFSGFMQQVSFSVQ